MRLKNGFNNIKTKSGAVFNRRAGFIHLIESVKNIRKLVLGYSLARVGYGENKLFTVLFKLKVYCARFVGKLNRIVNKIIYNLMNKVTVGIYRNTLYLVKPRNIKLLRLDPLLLTYNNSTKELPEIEKLRL